MTAKRAKIELRVTYEQKELLRAAAEEKRLPTSTWMIDHCLAERMDDSRIPAQPGTEPDILQRRTISDAEGRLQVELGPLLRDIRGELVGIRSRLDGLAAIERQLSYQGQRMAAIEKRFATLLETRLDGPKLAPPGAGAIVKDLT